MRCDVHGGEGREHDDHDIDLVAGSLCDVRRWQQQDTRSCGGSGDGGGGTSPTFGVGKVDRRPLHGVVGLADRVGEIDGALWVFTSLNRPEGAMLSMDGDPLQFDSERRIFGGHLEVNRQLPDGILPPQRAPIKDIHDGALKECLGIVYIAVDVLCSMVSQNSVRDGVDDRAHLIPQVNLDIANNDDTEDAQKEESRGAGGVGGY